MACFFNIFAGRNTCKTTAEDKIWPAKRQSRQPPTQCACHRLCLKSSDSNYILFSAFPSELCRFNIHKA